MLSEDGTVSRSTYLLAVELFGDQEIDLHTAIERVATSADEHPEWDMREQKLWSEWEKEYAPKADS